MNRLSSNHAGPVRRPVAGDNYATVTKGYGLRQTTWLLTPRTNHRRRTSIRILRSMAGKRLTQQQSNVNLYPQVASRGRHGHEAWCARRRKTKTPLQRIYPIDIAADFFLTQKRFRIDAATAEDCFDGGRRRQYGLRHRSSTRGFQHDPT